VSTYDLFRKRIAPLAFFAAIVLIARDSCNKEQRAHATIVLDFGAAEASVRAVDAELLVAGASYGNFHRIALPGHRIGTTQFDTAMPEPDGELRIDVDLGAAHKRLVRRIHVEDGATVRVSLAGELASP